MENFLVEKKKERHRKIYRICVVHTKKKKKSFKNHGQRGKMNSVYLFFFFFYSHIHIYVLTVHVHAHARVTVFFLPFKGAVLFLVGPRSEKASTVCVF